MANYQMYDPHGQPLGVRQMTAAEAVNARKQGFTVQIVFTPQHRQPRPVVKR